MSIDVNEQLNQYLLEWKNDAPNENVIETLSKISDLIEKETEAYYKMDPDPFDDRHPSRAKPTCSFGPLLKNLFKNDDFMNKLVNDYMMNRDDKELQIASCRLVLDILPGLETSVVFNDTDGLLERLLSWARGAEEPLQSYAIGLLAAAMDVQDIAAHSKEQNIQLMPIMIVKLKDLIQKSVSESNHLEVEETAHQTPLKRRRISSPSNECSNSSWAEMEPLMIGSAKIFPLTNEISQRFIYQYLTSLGVYQDMLSFVFEHSVLSLILNTIDLNKNGDVRLAFDALKYLASLLCHKKFALEFVNAGGIQSLLKVNRQSVAANGVAYCLNCIAYHDDVMEKICFLPHLVLENLVSYALWLVETSHDSSRSNAMIFFSLSFSYRMILNLFDSQDGFRKIINEISMIDLFSSPNSTYSEDEIFTKRQYAKHVCFALKRYYEAHLIIRTHELLKNSSYSNKISPRWARLINMNVPPYKTINYDYELYMEHVEALLHLMPARVQWRPVDDLIKFNGAKLLIQYISLSYDWSFAGKADAVRSALDVLVVCSVMAKFQALLSDSVVINEGHSTAGMRIILAAACGEIVNDADCQRSALNVIINCVCGPMPRPGGSTIRLSMGSSKKKSKCYDDILKQMWTSVRFNNGIMILLNLMMIKTPITDADSIRTLSCKALCGLARSETVRQVMGKLPLFSNGQIQALLKEPILQDKRSEHIKFVKYCLELIASVTGSPVETASLEDSVGNNLNKAEVITQTKIVFNEKELLQLIYKHLVEKGLSKTALALVDEAKLSDFANSFTKNSSFSKFNTPPKTLPRVSRQISVLSQNSNIFQTPLSNAQSSTSHNDSSANLNIPIRINRTQRSNRVNNSNSVASISNRRQSFHFTSPMAKRRTDFPSNNVISLDSIVIEYLRKQHALCKNPVMTCPPFDLSKPHRCPDPKNSAIAPVNITSRLLNREVFPPSGGMFGSKMDRKFIYSRFRPFRSLRAFDPTNFLCSAFSYSGNLLYVGTDNGELHVFNYLTSEIEQTFPCYDSVVSSIEPSWDGKLLLTSSFWDPPNSILWSITESSLEQKQSFTHDNHVEFGKAVQDKVLGTAEFAAHLYSLGTGQLVRTFDDEDYANRYVKNIATFHPSDHLILNDGVLWDIRAEKPIHKFDKFNQHINGIFHPNGQEIISNSEIWDIKTYKLLNTVPALSGSHIKFNKRGDIVYGVYEDDTVEELEEDKLPFSSSFRTFDGRDYSSIATIDVKRSITHLAIDPSDNYIAIIENQCNRDNSIFSHDKVARVYEIGKCREEDDEERDDDDEDEGDEESDGDSFDDEDDIMADELMSDSSSNALDIEYESDYDTSNSSSMSSDDDDDADDDDNDESDEEIFYQLNN